MAKVNDLAKTIANGEKNGLAAKINIIKEANAGLKQNIQIQETKNQEIDAALAQKLTDDKNADEGKKKAKNEETVQENNSILGKIMDMLRKPNVVRTGEVAVNQQATESPQRKEERSSKKDLETKYGKLSKAEYNDMVGNRFTLKTPKSF